MRNSGQSSEPIISSLQWDVLMKGGGRWHAYGTLPTPEHRMIGSYPNPAQTMRAEILTSSDNYSVNGWQANGSHDTRARDDDSFPPAV